MTGFSSRIALMLLAMGLCSAAEAREFRQLQPIRSSLSLLEPSSRAESFEPVDPSLIHDAVAQVLQAWAERRLENLLSESFYDRIRLLDALDTVAPRDAKLRLLGIQRIQLLEQFVTQDPESPSGDSRVVRLAITVSTQTEYTGPNGILHSLPGVNELEISITQPLLGAQ